MRPSHIAISAITGAIALISAFIFDYETAAASIILGWAMLAIAISDARSFRIPDVISLPMAPVGLLVTYWLSRDHEMLFEHFAYASLAAAALYGLNVAFRRFRGRDGLGLGDVKLVAVAGAWTGAGVANVVLIASMTAIAVVLLAALCEQRDVRRDLAIPFGVYLAPAIWLIWCLKNMPSVI